MTEHSEGLIQALPCKMWDPSDGQLWLEDFPLVWPRLSWNSTAVWNSSCPKSFHPCLLRRTQTHITVSRFSPTFSGSYPCTLHRYFLHKTSYLSNPILISASQRPWINTAVLITFVTESLIADTGCELPSVLHLLPPPPNSNSWFS